MKVLHYMENFSLYSETFIYDLINNLEVCEVDNYVLTWHRQLESERPFPKVEVLEWPSLMKKIYLKLLPIKENQAEKKSVKYIRKIKPDVIHAHFGINGVKIYRLLRKYNFDIPLIISFHGFDINVMPYRNSQYLKNFLNINAKQYLKELLNINADKRVVWVVPSLFLKNKILSLGLDGKTAVIPSAYHTVFENTSKAKYWQYGDELKLLNIGRFAEVKGQVYLIEAFAKLLKIYPNAKLTLIGVGSLLKKAQKQCMDLDVADKVVFLGRLAHQKIPAIMATQDIYIQPSIVADNGAEESLGLATIEAQVFGLPAIVSKIGGLGEIVIENESGKFFPQKDVAGLLECIMGYINTPKLLMQHAMNAKKIKAKFNKDNITKEVREVYETLLAEQV